MGMPRSGTVLATGELDRVWDGLAADRPSGNRRIPVFGCVGPAADRQVRSFFERLAS